MALIGWWPLNGTLEDYSINNTEATLKGTVNIVDGLYKKAYSVESTSGAIQTNVGSGINPGDGFSISIWAKSDNASGNRLIFATNNGSNQRYYISQHSSKWEFAVRNIAWNNADSKIPVVADRWTHLVLTTIGGTTSFYVDGEFSHSKEHGSFILPSNFNIGNHGPGSESDSYRFRGSLQDARIYDHALSTKEIKELYKANILSYSFDRDEEIVFDNSGYLNNGTLGSSVVQENNYIVFNGNSNSRIVGEKIFEDNNNQIWTVMATIELDSNTKAGQYLNNFNLGNRIVYSGANGKALLYINSGGNDSYTYSTGAIPNGEKIHIAFVLNTYTQRCQFYLNGSLYGTSTNYESTDVPNGFASTHIIGQGFEGKMYDFKIYARDLTSDEIAEEYKTKMSLDRSGNLYIDELVEDDRELIHWLDGNNAPVSNVWKDSVGDLDFSLTNTTYDSTEKCYKFGSSSYGTNSNVSSFDFGDYFEVEITFKRTGNNPSGYNRDYILDLGSVTGVPNPKHGFGIAARIPIINGKINGNNAAGFNLESEGVLYPLNKKTKIITGVRKSPQTNKSNIYITEDQEYYSSTHFDTFTWNNFNGPFYLNRGISGGYEGQYDIYDIKIYKLSRKDGASFNKSKEFKTMGFIEFSSINNSNSEFKFYESLNWIDGTDNGEDLLEALEWTAGLDETTIAQALSWEENIVEIDIVEQEMKILKTETKIKGELKEW